MIFLDSRYADGTLFKAWHAGKQEYHLTVFIRFFFYLFKILDCLQIINL